MIPTISNVVIFFYESLKSLLATSVAFIRLTNDLFIAAGFIAFILYSLLFSPYSLSNCECSRRISFHSISRLLTIQLNRGCVARIAKIKDVWNRRRICFLSAPEGISRVRWKKIFSIGNIKKSPECEQSIVHFYRRIYCRFIFPYRLRRLFFFSLSEGTLLFDRAINNEQSCISITTFIMSFD